ncbi:MAG: hypothetical protein ABH849_03380 [Nanoarchaeota archaeon]
MNENKKIDESQSGKNKIKNRIIGNLWKYANNDLTKQTEGEFLEFLDDYKEREEAIKKYYPSMKDDELKRIAVSFNTAYLQRKMVESNSSLKIATWVLAISTIIFTTINLLGAKATQGILAPILQGGLIFFITLAIVAFVWTLVKISSKKIIKRILVNQPHVICGVCGRIVTEYEEEGDEKPAITTCPNCLEKSIKKK